jgi:5S rRNA maturation endonuclease (ribonuclease M5)
MRVAFFDFDGCLMNSPEDTEQARLQYEAVTGAPYPHKGWWGRKESLSLEVYDIQPIFKMDKIMKEAMADPNTKVVLLTNRLLKLKAHVEAILDKHQYKCDMYTYMDKDNKGQRLRKILERDFPNATEAVFYDDDQRHLRDAREATRGFKVPVKLYIVDRGELREFN